MTSKADSLILLHDNSAQTESDKLNIRLLIFTAPFRRKICFPLLKMVNYEYYELQRKTSAEYYVTHSGDRDQVESLIKNGADVNTVDDEDADSLLNYAIVFSNSPIFDWINTKWKTFICDLFRLYKKVMGKWLNCSLNMVPEWMLPIMQELPHY